MLLNHDRGTKVKGLSEVRLYAVAIVSESGPRVGDDAVCNINKIYLAERNDSVRNGIQGLQSGACLILVIGRVIRNTQTLPGGQGREVRGRGGTRKATHGGTAPVLYVKGSVQSCRRLLCISLKVDI
jgi:hypothetical protein